MTEPVCFYIGVFIGAFFTALLILSRRFPLWRRRSSSLEVKPGRLKHPFKIINKDTGLHKYVHAINDHGVGIDSDRWTSDWYLSSVSYTPFDALYANYDIPEELDTIIKGYRAARAAQKELERA